VGGCTRNFSYFARFQYSLSRSLASQTLYRKMLCNNVSDDAAAEGWPKQMLKFLGSADEGADKFTMLALYFTGLHRLGGMAFFFFSTSKLGN
jgi:hypothetical protein